jgi:hypothetical protein
VFETPDHEAKLEHPCRARALRPTCGRHYQTQYEIQRQSANKKPSVLRTYLIMAGAWALGLKGCPLISIGILAYATGARCTSNPCRRSSFVVFCSNSHYLLAAGLNDLLTVRSSTTDGSLVTSSSSSELTSLDR